MKRKYVDITRTTSQLTRLRDAHKLAANNFLFLFNRSRIPGSDIHAPLSPLRSFYQQQTEYHSARVWELEAAIADYQHAWGESIEHFE